MLNILWAAMIGIGVLWGACTGQMEAVSNGLLEGGKDAVELCITMLGIVGMWCGVMEIASRSGIVQAMTRRMAPVIGLLFPEVPQDHPAMDAICLNVTANILGLGWAATPAGLTAMKELSEIREEKNDRASDAMCTFLVLNISSLQLLPVNMIAYRSSCGSAVPAIITGPAILATTASTAAGILFCLLMTRGKRKRSMSGKSRAGLSHGR